MQTMTHEFDGRYYAKDRAVFKAPKKSTRGISMGFCVCELSDGVEDDGAQEIADALNAAEAANQPHRKGNHDANSQSQNITCLVRSNQTQG